MIKYDEDFYYLESYDDLILASEEYWKHCGITDRGSCIEFYKRSFSYPKHFMFGLNYTDEDEIAYINIRTISDKVINSLIENFIKNHVKKEN